MIPDITPFFSIIIPTYNSSDTLQNCLNSIEHQSCNNYEVIIIDGVSVDSTMTIVKNNKLKIPQLSSVSEKDEGIYDAMNKGIAMAKGEYLYFLGSDDSLFDENVLSAIKEKVTGTKARVIYGNVIMRGSNQWVEDGLVHAGKFDLKRLLNSNICHQSIFYHHSVFKKLGNFNIGYKVFADYDFNLRCFANYKFHYADKIIANFHVGGSSTRLTDDAFENDKNKNIIRYFFKKLFTSDFVDSRLFVQRAAFSKNTGISAGTRLYCLLAYTKLKTQSLLK